MKTKIVVLAVLLSAVVMRMWAGCYMTGLYFCHQGTVGPWVTCPLNGGMVRDWSTTAYVARAAGGALVGLDDIGYYDTTCDWTDHPQACYVSLPSFPHSDPVQGSIATGSVCGFGG